MHLRSTLLAGVILATAMGSAHAQSKSQCTTDQDCSDHVYCNGAERCVGSNGIGTCVAAEIPTPCSGMQRCDEAAQRCITLRTDEDGDGHNSLATGGDDCDDLDVHRFPGNAEVFDDADHDEDCNLYTHGMPATFGNLGVPGRGQVCSGEDVVVLERMEGADNYSSTSCGTGMACAGRGVCVAKDASYVAQAKFAVPTAPQAQPSHAVKAVSAVPPTKLTMPMAPIQTRSPLATKAPVAVPTATSKTACPTGQAYSVAVGKCIPIPPR